MRSFYKKDLHYPFFCVKLELSQIGRGGDSTYRCVVHCETRQVYKHWLEDASRRTKVGRGNEETLGETGRRKRTP